MKRDNAAPHSLDGQRPPLALREEHKRLTRRRVLDAARTVFATHGYGAATVEEIVAAAGVGRATFYLHFANKSDVLAALSHELEPEAAAYWRKLDQALRSRETLRLWLAEGLAWWETHRRILPAMREAAASDPVFAARQYELLRRMTETLADYFATVPGPKRAEWRLRLELLVLQLDQFCLHWIVQQVIHEDRRIALDVLTDLWCAALQIPTAPRSADHPLTKAHRGARPLPQNRRIA